MVLIVHFLDRFGNIIHVVVNIFEDGCTYRIGFEYTAVTNLDLRNLRKSKFDRTSIRGPF